MANRRKDIHKPTKKGYIRLRRDGIAKMEHVMVWEKHYGKIPDGHQIHHIDGDKKNNDISNLQLVTALEHKRIHEGCKFENGEWYKPCAVCGEYKRCDTDNWYFSRGWISGRLCKKCYCKKVCDRKKNKVLKNIQPTLF